MSKGTNESHELEMKAIANEMAIYFSEHFTIKELIIWQMQATDAMFEYYAKQNEKIDTSITGFLNSLCYELIPGLMDAKTEIKRKDIIEKELINIFFGVRYKGLKKCLATIGSAFLSNYSALRQHESVRYFMLHLSELMHISEMYSEYEFLLIEGPEEKMAA